MLGYQHKTPAHLMVLKKINLNVQNSYQKRYRFQIHGMGYSWRAKTLGVCISTGKSHDLLIKTNMTGEIRGFKSRLLIFRSQNCPRTANQLLQNLVKGCPPTDYHKKGIVPFKGKYVFKKGKKKFV